MKRFIIKILLFFAPFFIICVHYLFVINNITGDIGWLGYIPFGKYEIDCNLPESNRVIDCYSVQELKNAEIISIGDSFNRIESCGNFSNYIGNELNRDVFRMQITLSNYKLLDSLIETNSFPNCKVLILESVERGLIYRLNFGDSNQKELCFEKKKEETSDWKSLLTINDYNSFIRLSVNYNNPIKSFKLDRQCFSCDYCKDELFVLNSIDDSELGFKNISQEQFVQAKKNLMDIKSKVESHGINLVFIAAADKYDMYYNHIQGNNIKNPTLEYFSDIDSTFFVNTKSLLIPYLDDGVQDIYLANDTHWSPIAAEIVGKHVADIIETQGYLND